MLAHSGRRPPCPGLTHCGRRRGSATIRRLLQSFGAAGRTLPPSPALHERSHRCPRPAQSFRGRTAAVPLCRRPRARHHRGGGAGGVLAAHAAALRVESHQPVDAARRGRLDVGGLWPELGSHPRSVGAGLRLGAAAGSDPASHRHPLPPRSLRPGRLADPALRRRAVDERGRVSHRPRLHPGPAGILHAQRRRSVRRARAGPRTGRAPALARAIPTAWGSASRPRRSGASWTAT